MFVLDLRTKIFDLLEVLSEGGFILTTDHILTILNVWYDSRSTNASNSLRMLEYMKEKQVNLFPSQLMAVDSTE